MNQQKSKSASAVQQTNRADEERAPVWRMNFRPFLWWMRSNNGTAQVCKLNC